jgi:hypothetical protein
MNRRPFKRCNLCLCACVWLKLTIFTSWDEHVRYIGGASKASGPCLILMSYHSGLCNIITIDLYHYKSRVHYISYHVYTWTSNSEEPVNTFVIRFYDYTTNHVGKLSDNLFIFSQVLEQKNKNMFSFASSVNRYNISQQQPAVHVVVLA